MSPLFRSLVLATALAVPVVVPAGAVVTLDEAIQQALTHNAGLRAASASTRAAQDRARAARGNFLPQLGVRYMARRSDNPLDAFADKLNTRSVTAADLDPAAINEPGTSTIHATQLSIELPLYTGGRNLADAREASAQAEAADHALDHHRQTVIFQTVQAWRVAQAARQSEAIANDAVTAAREHAETTARLLRQGRIVASDKLTAELNLAAAESAREQSAHRTRLALDALRRVTGMNASDILTLPDWQDPAPLSATPEATTSVQTAHATRADLKARVAWLGASEARIRAARAAFHPQVGVVASDTWYDSNAALDNKSQSIMGVVNFNLFTGGRDWHRLSAAQHETEAARQQLEDQRQAVTSDVRAAVSQLHAAQTRRAVSTHSIEQARENVRLIKQRYGEGRTLLIDLLMAERVLVEARHEALNAALAQDIGVVQLQFTEGRLQAPESRP